MESKLITKMRRGLGENRFLSFFLLSHTLFAIFLGRLFAFAPDEGAYLYTFNNLYGESTDANPQYNSGWITAPKLFLWIAYLPAKILNLIGVPDFLSIRILSILLAAFSLYLLLSIQKQSQALLKFSQMAIFAVYFVPSVFLWTTVGLRESFIIAEISAFLAGVNFLIQEKNKRAFALLFLGSYGLVSTKNYLWACLMVAVLVSCVLFIFQGIDRRKIVKFLVAGLLVPVIAFASTTSLYALEFILHSDITETGLRSGDSISQINVGSLGTGTGIDTGIDTDSGTGIDTGIDTDSGTGTVEPTPEVITFHGDYTLIALHFYLLDNPNSWFSKVFAVFKLDDKVQNLWNEKVQVGLVSEDNQVGSDTSSLNGHILEPGKITDPISMLWPAFVFLCGPFPFIGNPGIAAYISSLESPLWWIFYTLVIFQFIRFRKTKFLRDPQILFTLIFLAGEIAFSALVEVNLGTSFRHRSILLVPLVFLYVRLAQRAKEQKDLELGNI